MNYKKTATQKAREQKYLEFLILCRKEGTRNPLHMTDAEAKKLALHLKINSGAFHFAKALGYFFPDDPDKGYYLPDVPNGRNEFIIQDARKMIRYAQKYSSHEQRKKREQEREKKKQAKIPFRKQHKSRVKIIYATGTGKDMKIHGENSVFTDFGKDQEKSSEPGFTFSIPIPPQTILNEPFKVAHDYGPVLNEILITERKDGWMLEYKGKHAYQLSWHRLVTLLTAIVVPEWPNEILWLQTEEQHEKSRQIRKDSDDAAELVRRSPLNNMGPFIIQTDH